MKSIINTVLFLCMASIVQAQAEKDPNTLFLCSYDTGIDADFAAGEPSCIDKTPLPSGKKGYSGSAAVLSKVSGKYNLVPNKGFIRYFSEKNIKADKGTIEFYFFLFKAPSEYKSRVYLFKSGKRENSTGCFWDPSRAIPNLWFWVNKGDKKAALSVKMENIKKETWHRIALCWDENCLYLTLDTNFKKISHNLEALTIAETFTVGGHHFSGMIDELRISDVPKYTEMQENIDSISKQQ